MIYPGLAGLASFIVCSTIWSTSAVDCSTNIENYYNKNDNKFHDDNNENNKSIIKISNKKSIIKIKDKK